MLLSLGIGSQIGMLEGMLCTIFDIEMVKRIRKQYVTGKWKKFRHHTDKHRNTEIKANTLKLQINTF